MTTRTEKGQTMSIENVVDMAKNGGGACNWPTEYGYKEVGSGIF